MPLYGEGMLVYDELNIFLHVLISHMYPINLLPMLIFGDFTMDLNLIGANGAKRAASALSVILLIYRVGLSTTYYSRV